MKYFNLTNMFACTNCGAVSKVEGKEHEHWHGFCPNCMSPMRVHTSNVEPERPERKWKTGHPEHPEKVWVFARYDYPNEYFVEYEIDQWDFTHNRWSEDRRIRTVLGWCEIPEFDLEVTE